MPGSPSVGRTQNLQHTNHAQTAASRLNNESLHATDLGAKGKIDSPSQGDAPTLDSADKKLAKLTLIKILFGLKLSFISLDPKHKSISTVDDMIESCKKLNLIESDNELNDEAVKEFHDDFIWNILKVIHQYIPATPILKISDEVANNALRNVIYGASSINEKNTSNTIDNAEINKENSTHKKHLEDFCLLQRPFVAFGRNLCEVWISLLESIKSFAKAAQTFITSYITAEGRQKRELEKLKNDLFDHVKRIFDLNGVILSS